MRDSVAVRTIALIEATKGSLALLAAIGVHALLHGNAARFVDAFVRHSHLNPARHYPGIFLRAVANMSDAWLWLLALGAATYAGLRLLEAYGLWFDRSWAKWLAILSGAIYLPVEVYEFAVRRSPIGLLVLTINLLVIAVMLRSVRAAESR